MTAFSKLIFVTALILGLFFGSKIVYALNSGPTQMSPLDGSTITSSTLTWQTPTYSLYTTNPYNVQVDDDPTFASVNKNYLTNNLTYSPALSDGIWYWRIRSKDSTGTYSSWSDTWVFTLNTSLPSPSPTPQPSPSTSPLPIPSPDPTPSPTPSPSPSPTPSPSPSPSPIIPKFEVLNTPSNISSSDAFLVDVNLLLPVNPLSVFYLKGAFVKSGSTNYFGFTKVVDSWVENSSSYSYQKQILTDSTGNWSGQIEVMPDEEDSGFIGSGDYIFKVARYTQTGSGPTWSNESTINITQPTPSPSPSPSPSPTPASQGITSQFQISGIPPSINSLDSIKTQVNISLQSNPNTIYYLKGAFVKTDSSNYFGKTLVNDYWVKNSASYSSQLKITTDSAGNWSGSLEAMPDSDDSGFTGTGNYLFKVARYTDSGSGPTWSNQLSLNITEIPKPSPSPSPAVALAKEGSVPVIQSESAFTTNSATSSASPNPDLQIPLLNEHESSVAGEAIKSSITENQTNNLSPFQKMNWWFITAGLTTITATGSFLLKNIKSFTIPQWLLKVIQQKTQENSQQTWPKSFSKKEA